MHRRSFLGLLCAALCGPLALFWKTGGTQPPPEASSGPTGLTTTVAWDMANNQPSHWMTLTRVEASEVSPGKWLTVYEFENVG